MHSHRTEDYAVPGIPKSVTGTSQSLRGRMGQTREHQIARPFERHPRVRSSTGCRYPLGTAGIPIMHPGQKIR